MSAQSILPLLLCVVILACAAGCGPSEPPGGASLGTDPKPDDTASRLKGRLVIFHAASLAKPFATLERIFEQQHPDVDVIRESSSSRLAIRKVTGLQRAAELVASADEALLRELMLPEHADWVAQFARNRVVIGYSPESRYRDEITAENWYRILLRPDVGYGYCDPGMAPIGYRTLIVWQLADGYYDEQVDGKPISEALIAGCPKRNRRPHVNELLPLLESLRLDYAFMYRSVALQHRLPSIKLPDEIDLGSVEHAKRYAGARVELPSVGPAKKIVHTGKPVIYGISLVKDARNEEAAVAFLALLLGPDGRKVMEESFQEPIAPAVCASMTAAPESLRPFMIEEAR